MRVKNREIVTLKKRLKENNICGLALDVDETLSFTIGYMVTELMKKFGNPENLTAEEIARKYKHTKRIPYWQGEECKKLIREIIKNNELQKAMPLIENSNLLANKLIKIIPILAYITARPRTILNGTIVWLRKHNFPKATIITRVGKVNKENPNKWKARVLEFLYPEIQGIVDDSPELVEHLSKRYKGTVFLYDNTETKRNDIKVIPCKKWKDVLVAVKKEFNGDRD
jgi:hypothetical protein